MTDTDDAYVYDDATGEWIPASEAAAKTGRPDADTLEVRDSVGNLLADGDSVTLIKDLTVKGANQTLKRGTVIKSLTGSFRFPVAALNATSSSISLRRGHSSR